MLDVIEFYVSLLDDKSANEILSRFNETVPGFSKHPPLKLKKDQILQIFKRQTVKSRRAKTDPFYKHFHQAFHLNDLAEVTSKEEFLARISKKDLPEHVKFALLIKFDIKIIEEILPELVTKYKSGEKLFDFVLEIKTDEEALKYLSQDLFLNDSQKEIFLKYLLPLLTDEQKKQFKKEINRVKEMSPKEFYLYYQNSEDNGLSSLAYALINESIDYKLFYGLATNYLYIKAKKSLEEIDVLIKSSINQTEVAELESALQELKKKLVESEECNKEIVTLKKAVYILQEENEEMKKKISQKELENVQLNISNKLIIEKENMLYQTKLQEKNKEIINLNREIENWKVDITETINNFCVLSESPDVPLVQNLFPEIIFVTFKEWEKQKDKLIEKGLNRVYIQQNGVSSKRLFAIQKSMNGIENSTFVMHDHKSLIELLSVWKRGVEINV